MLNPNRRRAATALLAAMAILALPATAQEKAVRLIVPATAGSTVDGMGRAISGAFGKALGLPVVVENIVGAGGVPGTQQIVSAPKDGFTLGIISSNHVINPGVYKNMPFDSLADITPISVVGTVPLMVVINPQVKAKNTRELMEYMRANPGKLNVGIAGNGSSSQLGAVLFATESNAQVRYIPYKGTVPVVTDLIGGQIDMAVVAVQAAAPHIQSGRLRAIGVTTKQRSPMLPDVPTLAESGLPNYSFDAWLALIGPSQLPRPLVTRYYAALRTALAQPEVVAAFDKLGIVMINGTPDQAVPFFKAELDKHMELIKASGTKAE